MNYFKPEKHSYYGFYIPTLVEITGEIKDVEIDGDKIKFTEIDGTWDYHHNADKDLIHRGFRTLHAAKEWCIKTLEEDYKNNMNKLMDMLKEIK